MAERQGWVGRFRVRCADGRETTVCNEIKEDARLLTLRLWAGQTFERFSGLRLLAADGSELGTKFASFTIEGSTLRAQALFEASQITDAPTIAQLISTDDRVLAEASLPDDLAAGRPYLIECEDDLAINTGA